jgi:peptidoglycan hydrolase CwlO-like protein
MEKINNEDYNSMVNTNTMLLSFEGWIKYIEGFSRGLQTTKTVDASQVFDCVGEIMEYMKTLKGQICGLLLHCEQILQDCEQEQQQYQEQIQQLEQINNENTALMNKIQDLQQCNQALEEENNKLKQALTILKEKTDGKM